MNESSPLQELSYFGAWVTGTIKIFKYLLIERIQTGKFPTSCTGNPFAYPLAALS